MIRGNFAQGDFWIDCIGPSLYLTRAIFGVWINFWIAVVAFCVRSLFRSHLRRRLLSNDPAKRNVSIWHISPATSPSEAFQIRIILAKAAINGHTFYVFASLFCVVATIISAASTTISNHAIVINSITRNSQVPGILVTSSQVTMVGAVVDVTTRVNALNRANAPLEELFDFIPSDNVSWIYSPDQWNNSWRGTCSYILHPAVDLVVYPTNSTRYQDEIPLLGNWLPQWATVDPTKQGRDNSGFYIGAGNLNASGAWRDMIATYAFGSSPYNGAIDYNASVQFALVNYLAHNVARDQYSTFLQTAFKSDVHVVDCTFHHFGPGSWDQSRAQGGQYMNVAQDVAEVRLIFYLFISRAIHN